MILDVDNTIINVTYSLDLPHCETKNSHRECRAIEAELLLPVHTIGWNGISAHPFNFEKNKPKLTKHFASKNKFKKKEKPLGF